MAIRMTKVDITIDVEFLQNILLGEYSLVGFRRRFTLKYYEYLDLLILRRGEYYRDFATVPEALST